MVVVRLQALEDAARHRLREWEPTHVKEVRLGCKEGVHQ